MEDKIFMKTKSDGIWENNPTLAFARNLGIYLFIFFGSMFGFIFMGVPNIILALWLIFISVYLVANAVSNNQSKNMSKSTAFIERDVIIYAIQLLYSSENADNVSQKKHDIYAIRNNFSGSNIKK
ncbi:MAG TPA: hypothetical protein PKY25_01655 [Bacilli bacterium]|nr:hypothetical protein [Bacilli bacterium]